MLNLNKKGVRKLEEGIEMGEYDFLEEFVEEAKEYLENIEIKILELERYMNKKETILPRLYDI